MKNEKRKMKNEKREEKPSSIAHCSLFIYFFLFSFLFSLFSCTNPFMERLFPPETKANPTLAIIYTVSFDSNGGSKVPSQAVREGGLVTEPPKPSKSDNDGDWYFVGWFDETLTERWNFSTDTVTGNMTLYADWTRTAFTVTFMNGENEFDKQIVGENGNATKPNPDPEKDGDWYFAGWYSFDDIEWDFDTDTVTDHITLYAKWLPLYTVTFNSNGGSPTPEPQKVAEGKEAKEPDDPPDRMFVTVAGLYKGSPEEFKYILAGWLKDGELYDFETPVSGNITLTALWTEPEGSFAHIDYGIVPKNDVAEAVNYVNDNPATYTLLLDADAPIPTGAQTLDKAGVDLTIIGIGSGESTIQATSAYLFTVSNAMVSLTLGENIILSGNNGSYEFPLVRVTAGKLTMLDGSKITNYNNTSMSPSFAGVIHLSGGSFTMEGGEISGNTAVGVYILVGTFTMEGGGISGNEATNGGGVFVHSGTFTMEGGGISGNEATNGGGVYVNTDGNFTMTGGEISENTAIDSGGGVYTNGTFNMTGGKISGNSVEDGYGGGVFVESNFTMSGGEINGNEATYGGGVRVSGTFSMSGGEINGNNDVRVSWGSHVSFTLSGTANIGVITLEADSSIDASSITIDNGFNAATKTTLNLYSYSNDMVTGWWENKQVIKAGTGHTLTSNDIGKFTLGQFIYSGGSRSISNAAEGDNYYIETSVFGIGRLVKFDPVTGISGVPTTGITVGTVTLTGTVSPVYATNTTIVWSVFDAGTTGATITSGGELSTTAPGTVIVRATIKDGLAWGTDYTQNFTITVKGSFIITIDFADMAPSIEGGTIFRNAENGPQTLSLTVTGSFDRYQWSIDGNIITDNATASSFTVNANDPLYTNIGSHTVYLVVYKDGVPYSKTIYFEVKE